jgi:hypothetical protein
MTIARAPPRLLGPGDRRAQRLGGRQAQGVAALRAVDGEDHRRGLPFESNDGGFAHDRLPAWSLRV